MSKKYFSIFRFTNLLWITILIFILIPLVQGLITYRSVIFSRSLIVFTNESEYRPCGGFASAFAEFQGFPWHFSMKDSYTLREHSFGSAYYPINQISAKKYFWDLGDKIDINACAYQFLTAYQNTIPTEADRIVFVNLRSVSALLELVGERDIFAKFSRNIAHVDRHNLDSLNNRKNPLLSAGNNFFTKIFWRPWKWYEGLSLLKKLQDRGDIFISSMNNFLPSQGTDFVFHEWNLGGAKSSRYLKNQLSLFWRQQADGLWDLEILLDIHHAGTLDEPLSQNWKGAFELRVPSFVPVNDDWTMTYNGSHRRFFFTEIAPGESFREKVLLTDISLPKSDDFEYFSLFRPRDYRLHFVTTVSLFPQQSFSQASFPFQENVGIWRGDIDKFHNQWSWQSQEDVLSPFVTFHEINAIEDKTNLVIEIHFNEAIDSAHLEHVEIFDTDTNVTDISENPEIQEIIWPNNHSMMIRAIQSQRQEKEFYRVRIGKVRDIFGNQMPIQEYTVVDRVK